MELNLFGKREQIKGQSKNRLKQKYVQIKEEEIGVFDLFGYG